MIKQILNLKDPSKLPINLRWILQRYIEADYNILKMPDKYWMKKYYIQFVEEAQSLINTEEESVNYSEIESKALYYSHARRDNRKTISTTPDVIIAYQELIQKVRSNKEFRDQIINLPLKKNKPVKELVDVNVGRVIKNTIVDLVKTEAFKSCMIDVLYDHCWSSIWDRISDKSTTKEVRDAATTVVSSAIDQLLDQVMRDNSTPKVFTSKLNK